MTFWKSDPSLTFRTCAWKIWRLFERNSSFLFTLKMHPFWKLAWKNAVMDYMPGDSLWLNHLKGPWTFTIPKRSGSQNCQVIVTLHLANKQRAYNGPILQGFGALDSSVPLRISSCSDFFAQEMFTPYPKHTLPKTSASFWWCLRSHLCFIFTQKLGLQIAVMIS